MLLYQHVETSTLKMPNAQNYDGREPERFRFMDNGEEYCIGNEVGNYLRLLRGDLYKRYPALWRRFMTQEEKIFLREVGLTHLTFASKITLLKASEVDAILEGRADHLKTSTAKVRKNTNKELLTLLPGKKFPICFDDTNPPITLDSSCKPVKLIPIRLYMEIGDRKLRDTLIWNKNEVRITPQQIAKILCDDLGLSLYAFVPTISSNILKQCGDEPFEQVDELTDTVVIVKLNVHIGSVPLNDQLELDLAEKETSPIEFSKQLCQELCLGEEFITSVAHAIRGQIFWADPKEGEQ